MDPVDAFLFCRSKASSECSATQERGATVTPKVSRSKDVITPMSCLPCSSPQRLPEQMALTIPKLRIITIAMTEPFVTVLKIIDSFSETYLSVVKKSQLLPSTKQIQELKADYTRFLIKQLEKNREDKDESVADPETLKALMVLYIMSLTRELLVHCCLEPAVASLSALSEKYSCLVGGALENLRRKLFELHCIYCEKGIIHPKCVSLCKTLIEYLKQCKNLCSQTGYKVLVVVKRPLSSLTNTLCEVMSVGGELNPVICLPPVSTDVMNKNLEKYCSLIIHRDCIPHQFNLSRFTVVVEYEYQEPSELAQSCSQTNVCFVGLQMEGSTASSVSNDSELQREDEAVNSQLFTVIGSTDVTHNKDLLHILETRYNVLVVERDYNSLACGGRAILAPDILISANAGVILHPLNQLTQVWQVERLTRQLAVLSLKVLSLWIILHHPSSCNTASEGISNEESDWMPNVYKLHAALANLSCKTGLSLTYKVLICHDDNGIADMVRLICKLNSCCHSVEEAYPPFTDIASERENFLLTFPSLNSISAQLMLSKVTLADLLASSWKVLQKLYPEIPVHSLMAFQCSATRDTGLQLLNPETMPPAFSTSSAQVDSHMSDEYGTCSMNSCINPTPKQSETVLHSDKPSYPWDLLQYDVVHDPLSVELQNNFRVPDTHDLEDQQYKQHDCSDRPYCSVPLFQCQPNLATTAVARPLLQQAALPNKSLQESKTSGSFSAQQRTGICSAVKPQRVSIGLAQPLRRFQSQDGGKHQEALVRPQPSVYHLSKLDSPPLDLDYDWQVLTASQGQLQPHSKPAETEAKKLDEFQDYRKRPKAPLGSIPMKQRRLTYKAVAGMKGQTVLQFIS